MIDRTSASKDEIDLTYLIKSIWDKKILVILVMLISILLGVGINYKNKQLPIFEISIDIGESEKSEFLKYISINKVLVSKNLKAYEIKSETILKKFINELSTHENILAALEDNINVKKKISKLSVIDQNFFLLKYAKSLKLHKKGDNYNLKFIWDDAEEGSRILDEIIDYVLLVVQNKIYNDLENIIEIIKKLNLEENTKRIEFLKEQRDIAKELLEIKDKFSSEKKPNEQLEISIYLEKFEKYNYIRDYRAIDKEIELIENRVDREVNFLSKELELIRKKAQVNLISYNILNSNTKLLNFNNKNLTLTVSLILGFISSIILVLILNAFQDRTSRRRVNKN